MPKPIKKRVSKKGMEAPEIGVIQGFLHTVYEENRKAIIYTAVAVVVLAVAGTGLVIHQRRQAEKAAVFESQGIAEFDKTGDASGGESGDMSKALEYFKQAADARETQFSLFYAGESFLKLGDRENALKKYREFLRKFSDSSLAGAVMTRIAMIHEKMGDNEAALEELKKAGKEDVGGDTALSRMAELYKRMEKPELEQEVLKQLAAGDPDSPWTAEAKTRVKEEEKPAAGEAEASGQEGKNVTTEEEAGTVLKDKDG